MHAREHGGKLPAQRLTENSTKTVLRTPTGEKSRASRMAGPQHESGRAHKANHELWSGDRYRHASQ